MVRAYGRRTYTFAPQRLDLQAWPGSSILAVIELASATAAGRCRGSFGLVRRSCSFVVAIGAWGAGGRDQRSGHGPVADVR